MTALPAQQEQAVAELIGEQERRLALWTESHGTWSREIGNVFVTAFAGSLDWMWMITTPRWSAMSGANVQLTTAFAAREAVDDWIEVHGVGND